MNPIMQKIAKAIVFIFTRAAVFYLLVFLLSNTIIDYEKIKFSMQIRALNSIMPKSFATLLTESGPGKKINDVDLKAYMRFYQRVTEFFPEQADAYAMLGFCYFNKGDIARAIVMYRKAFDLNNQVFWINYNLGVLYAIANQDQEAENYLKRATVADPKNTLNFVVSSNVIFRSLMMDAGITLDSLRKNLNQGYFQAHLLLLIVEDRQKEFSEMLLTAQNAINLNFPRKEIFFYYAGYASLQLQDFTQAVKYFQESIQLNPNVRDVHSQLAAAIEKMGKDRGAVEAIRKAAVRKKQTVPSILQEYSFSPRVF